MQPGAREAPAALDCGYRNAEHLGDLAFVQTAEEPQLDDLPGLRMANAELPESFVEGEDLGRLGQSLLAGCVEWEVKGPACVLPAPCMFDEHSPHHQGS